MQEFRRWIAAVSSLLVAVASFALSYVALRDVAADIGAVPPHLAWLVPIVIDGGIMCGSAVIWSASREDGRRPVFPFLFVAAMVTISVVVNASHASEKPLAKVIAALPPLILLGTLELVASQGRKHLPAAAPAPAAVAPARPAPARPAPARQSWTASPILTPSPSMNMAAGDLDADLDPGLVDEIEQAFTSGAATRPARTAPARSGTSPAKRAPRVQAAQPDTGF